MEIWPGSAFPIGATYDGTGVNFSVFSELAERVDLCLFDRNGRETRVPLPEVTSYCWHGYLPNLQPGQRYGFRVHGPWDPERGLRCNPAKVLLDPYARAIEGRVRWNEAVFLHSLSGGPDTRNDADSGPFMPKAVVVNPFFDWSDDRPPRTPWHHTVIYETHVKGFSALHPEIPQGLRGTYAGLAHPVAIDHLKRLGVTAVELMPVHQFVHDWHLEQRGLRNYWGYNSIGFLAPHNEYAAGGDRGQQVQEFKQMVKALHRAGIEVILDVVYNHTAEGNHLGPVFSFKGFDNPAYYRLAAEPRHYMDYTGTGNSLNMRHPQVLKLIMDSLRYWVAEMHVDGFRFDLASALARELHEVDRLSAFFDLIHQDPVVSGVKLIAEPWDVGEGGYQVGNFPPLWSEWNGKYRDCVRDYWRSMDQTLSELASRFCGSSDLYATTERRPFASINFIAAHDGFTLRDLVSYNEKHNDANGEENRDGERHNRSWNCGVEGPTDDPDVTALRARQQRNLLTTLLLSQGTPMLLGGDELGRSQQGSNNAYCQDTELSWYHWDTADQSLIEFTRSLIRLRQAHPVFRRRRFFLGRPAHGKGAEDIQWYRPDGQEMKEEDWKEGGFAKSLGVLLNGKALETLDPRGRPLEDEIFYLMFNAHYEPLDFAMPAIGARWVRVLDTADGRPARVIVLAQAGTTAPVPRNGNGRRAAEELVAVAAHLCAVPTALWVYDRQIKSAVGLPEERAAQAATLVGQLAVEDLVEVLDTREDARFQNVPGAHEGGQLRFLAAMPVAGPDGRSAGTLAVCDHTPRRLSVEQRSGLRALGQVMGQLAADGHAAGNGHASAPGETDNDVIEAGQPLTLASRSVQVICLTG